jgi:hypothetical protein
VPTRRARCRGAQPQESMPRRGVEHLRPLMLAACEFGLGMIELAQAQFPFGLEAAGDQAVVGLDGTIAAFAARGLVLGAFDGQAPLGESRLAVRLEPFGGSEAAASPAGWSAFRKAWATA